MIPDDLKYTKNHEWLRLEGDVCTIGITDHAQTELGDIVFVELPEVGTAVEKGRPFGVIESVKAVSDLYPPVSGEVVDVNAELAERPEIVNEDCYGAGWMLAIAGASDEAIEALLDAAAYRKHVSERSE